MKISELRSLGLDELKQKVAGLKKEMFDFRMQAAAGKLDKPHRMSIARRDVARAMTLLNQLELEKKSGKS